MFSKNSFFFFFLLLLVWIPLNTRLCLLDDSSDTDLCSGRPVSGVTTLRNGTMVVFRGQRSQRLPGATGRLGVVSER